jgi:hypothetical protein
MEAIPMPPLFCCIQIEAAVFVRISQSNGIFLPEKSNLLIDNMVVRVDNNDRAIGCAIIFRHSLIEYVFLMRAI